VPIGVAALIFPAKVDLWFYALFYGGGALMLGLAHYLWKRTRGRLGAITVAACGLLFLMVAWRVGAMTLELTDDGFLDVRGWPFAGRITHVGKIQRVEPSRDPRSSLAASLDRLRIDYGQAGVVFIAVPNQAVFLDALSRHDSGLVRRGRGLRRD